MVALLNPAPSVGPAASCRTLADSRPPRAKQSHPGAREKEATCVGLPVPSASRPLAVPADSASFPGAPPRRRCPLPLGGVRCASAPLCAAIVESRGAGRPAKGASTASGLECQATRRIKAHLGAPQQTGNCVWTGSKKKKTPPTPPPRTRRLPKTTTGNTAGARWTHPREGTTQWRYSSPFC